MNKLKRLFSKISIWYRVQYRLGFAYREIGERVVIESDKAKLGASKETWESINRLICKGFDRYIYEGNGFLPNNKGRIEASMIEGKTAISFYLGFMKPTGWRKFVPMPLMYRREQIEELNKLMPKIQRNFDRKLLELMEVKDES